MRIRNWRKFQHYKRRTPPWIKLHRSLLDDPEWHALDGDASKMLAMCWLIASENDGELPDEKTLAFRLRCSESKISSNLSKLSGWIEGYASNVLASCKQHATPETETETETDYEKSFSEFYNTYPKRKSRKQAEKAYRAALKKTSHQSIMDGLKRAVDQDTRFRDPQFIPYPASWLNAGGYEDQHNVIAITKKMEAWS